MRRRRYRINADFDVDEALLRVADICDRLLERRDLNANVIILNANVMIWNPNVIILKANVIILNAQFIILNAEFIILN